MASAGHLLERGDFVQLEHKYYVSDSMTHRKSNISCFNRFDSKMAGTVGLWPASLPASRQVHSATSGLHGHDWSNFKMWSWTFAPTIACAPSKQRAIPVNASVAHQTTSSSWSLIHIKRKSVSKRKKDIGAKLTPGEPQVAHSLPFSRWVVWCIRTVPVCSIACTPNPVLEGLATQVFPQCSRKQVNPLPLAHQSQMWTFFLPTPAE
jgi:hypothetical protein